MCSPICKLIYERCAVGRDGQETLAAMLLNFFMYNGSFLLQ